MQEDVPQRPKTNPTRYHQIYETQHFFRKNDKTQPEQTGPKRGE